MADTESNRLVNFDLGDGIVVVVRSGLIFSGGPSVPKPPPKKTGRVSFYLGQANGPEAEELRLDIEVEVEYRAPAV